MNDRIDDVPDDEAGDRALLALLADQRPVPSPALGRRVRHRVEIALTRRAMRRYAVVCLSSGTIALAVAVLIALTSGRA